MSPGVRKVCFAGAVVIWVGLTGVGMKVLADYSYGAHPSEVPEEVWPADAHVEPGLDGFTLVVALHPECPCSRASLEEVDRMLAFGQRRLHVVAIFSVQGFSEAELIDSDLWQQAQRLINAVVVADPDGSELRRFKFRTSGETRLYAADGALRFSGGVTLSRGHAGGNPGRSAIEGLLSGSVQAPLTVTPVFGCGLFSHQSESDSQT